MKKTILIALLGVIAAITVWASIALNTFAIYNYENNGNDSGATAYTLTTNGTVPYSSSVVQQGTYSAGPYTDANYFTVSAAFKTAWNTVTASNGAWTWQGYIYPTGITNFPCILSNQDDTTYLQIHATLGMRLVCNNVTTAGFSYPMQTHLNAWTHVAWTYDGTTLRMYVDNNRVNSTVQNGTWGTLTTLRMGRGAGGSANFTGQIDQMRFSNACLATGTTGNFPTIDPSNGRSLRLNKLLKPSLGSFLNIFSTVAHAYPYNQWQAAQEIKVNAANAVVVVQKTQIAKGIISVTATQTPTITVVGTQTFTPTKNLTFTLTPSLTSTSTISPTPSISPTLTISPTWTISPTLSQTIVVKTSATVTDVAVIKPTATPLK